MSSDRKLTPELELTQKTSTIWSVYTYNTGFDICRFEKSPCISRDGVDEPFVPGRPVWHGSIRDDEPPVGPPERGVVPPLPPARRTSESSSRNPDEGRPRSSLPSKTGYRSQSGLRATRRVERSRSRLVSLELKFWEGWRLALFEDPIVTGTFKTPTKNLQPLKFCCCFFCGVHHYKETFVLFYIL